MSVRDLAATVEQVLALRPIPALRDAQTCLDDARDTLARTARGSSAPDLLTAVTGLSQATEQLVAVQQACAQVDTALRAYLTTLGVAPTPAPATHSPTTEPTRPSTPHAPPPDPELIAVVQRQGHKISPDRVVRIVRLPDQRVVWLEEGNDRSGLRHIMEPKRITNFERKDIVEDEIVDAIFDALAHGKPVGVSSTDRIVYEFSHRGHVKRIAISVSTNGYIVGAHPMPMTRKLKPLP